MAPGITEVKRKGRRNEVKMPLEVKMRALTQSDEIPKSIIYLVSEGITLTSIARELGCSRWMVWAWRRGTYLPRDPLLAFCLLEWAEWLRVQKSWAEFDAKLRAATGGSNGN